MIPAPPQTATDRFALILGALCRAVAARGADKRGCGGLAAGPVLVLLWTRLRRMATRFAALAARVRAGTLPSPAPAGYRAASRPASPPPHRLPRGFGWLIRLAPEAACHGSQLRHLLSDPEFSALVSAAPALRRVLRPLCHMLGIEPAPSLTPPSHIADTENDTARGSAPRLSTPAQPAPTGKAAGAHRLLPGLRPISEA